MTDMYMLVDRIYSINLFENESQWRSTTQLLHPAKKKEKKSKLGKVDIIQVHTSWIRFCIKSCGLKMD